MEEIKRKSTVFTEYKYHEPIFHDTQASYNLMINYLSKEVKTRKPIWQSLVDWIKKK